MACCAVDYDDGDEEWLDLDQERHKLLPATSEPAAAARKKHRKAVIVSDSEDDDEDHAGDASDDSNFEGMTAAGAPKATSSPALTVVSNTRGRCIAE